MPKKRKLSPKARKTWGKVNPATRVERDNRKRIKDKIERKEFWEEM